MTTLCLADPVAIWIAYNDAGNEGDHDRASHYIADELRVLVNERPAVASVAEGRAIQQKLIRCYPDGTREYHRGYAYGDWATVEWTMRGTTADGVGLPPSDVPGCSIIRCEDGRIVEARLYHPTGGLDLVVDRALGHR